MAAILALAPRLVVAAADEAITFYTDALGAQLTERYTAPSGKVVHAALDIGGFTVALKDEDEYDPAPTTLGGSPVVVSLTVDDADTVADRMIKHGATVVYPVADQPYGQRGGRVMDPSGHLWMISQTIEDLSPSEIQQRTDAMLA